MTPELEVGAILFSALHVQLPDEAWSSVCLSRTFHTLRFP